MKISILLITYNHERFIRKAVESILIQKECPEFEVIISDDHSTDQTLSIALELLQVLPNLRVISNEKNLGITANYRQGFSSCSGEYIFVLEGDDYWTDPFKLQKQTAFLDQHPFCVMCTHPYYTQKDDLGIFTAPDINESACYNLFDCKDIILDSSIGSNFSSCCYRRSALVKISPSTYDIISYEWMINISIAQFGLIGRINEAMSVYRLSSSGAWTKKSQEEQLRGILSILNEYDRTLDRRYTDYFEIKRLRTEEQLASFSPGSASLPARSLKSYLPPVFIVIAKLITPPALLKLVRNGFK